MMTILAVLLFVAVLPFVAAALYLAGLSVLALIPERRRPTHASTQRRFVILVPARDEESRLPLLLASITALEYPTDLVRTLVVADNCTDGTANIARAAGATVRERHNLEEVGKGYAIEHGLREIGDAYDALVLVDGDCSVSPNLLDAFNRRLDAGDEVVQAYYTMRTAGGSSTQAVRGLALALVHLVRPLGKRRVGASAGLKGSGMCFSRRVIAEAGWHAFGLAEDIEQHNRLLRMGLRVGFAHDAVVTGASPKTLGDARDQHRRWEAGRLAAMRSDAIPLLADGLRMRSMPRFDAGIELLVPPLSIVATALAAGFAAGLLVGSALVWGAALAGIASLVLYLLAGLWLQGLGWRTTLWSIATIPGYACWKLAVYAQSIAAKPMRWEQTRRTDADVSG